MNRAENYLSEAKNKICDMIKFLVADIYVKHGGSLEDVEKSVSDVELGRSSWVSVEVGTGSIEEWCIEDYVITDDELSFICGDNSEEVKPQEVSAEELVRIYTNLYNYWKKL